MREYKYDIVIATRNRTDALALSIPLLLAQSRLPENMIVVDSSDNPGPVREIVERNAASCDIPFKLIHSKPGLPLQRNIGLRAVTADVVFFPDDDSLVLPGALEAMMRIYELDGDGIVGGVCSAEAATAPASVLDAARSSYKMTFFERMKKTIAERRYALEHRLFPDPFFLHGRSRWDVKPKPSWLEQENAVLVERMTGFRMSFRTNLVKALRFDETLQRYALFEDTDVSFGMMKNHLLVGARNAQIYHHKAPGSRQGARASGFFQIFNRAYIICKYTQPGSAARRQLLPFSRYKIAQYALRVDNASGRARLKGSLCAYRAIPELLESAPPDLKKLYSELRDRELS